jgi:hypothetical protein
LHWNNPLVVFAETILSPDKSSGDSLFFRVADNLLPKI